MKRYLRPSQCQLNYLNVDILPFLEELGCDVENFEWEIHSINWYDWDNIPRWFTCIKKYNIVDGKEKGYIEVDIYCDNYNGDENPLGIEKINMAGHGYPCSSTQIVILENDGNYIIKGIE